MTRAALVILTIAGVVFLPFVVGGHPAAECAPSYPTVCIAPPPPDLNCPDIFPLTDFLVLPPDPHHFDADHDGVGCEAPPRPFFGYDTSPLPSS